MKKFSSWAISSTFRSELAQINRPLYACPVAYHYSPWEVVYFCAILVIILNETRHNQNWDKHLGNKVKQIFVEIKDCHREVSYWNCTVLWIGEVCISDNNWLNSKHKYIITCERWNVQLNVDESTQECSSMHACMCKSVILLKFEACTMFAFRYNWLSLVFYQW